MGNHTIDCDFCGQDQRLKGVRCCAQNIAYEAQKEKERVERVAAATAVCARWGIRVPYGVNVSIFDVASALEKTRIPGVLGDLAEVMVRRGLSLRFAIDSGAWVATLYSGGTPAGVGSASSPEEAIVLALADYLALRKVGHT